MKHPYSIRFIVLCNLAGSASCVDDGATEVPDATTPLPDGGPSDGGGGTRAADASGPSTSPVLGFGDAGAPGTASADAGAPGTASEDAGAPSAIQSCFGLPLPARAQHFDAAAPSSLATYFPTSEYRAATPEAAGMDAQKLELALSFATPTSHTEGVLVLRHGYIVGERYTAPFTRESLHESFSMAKSFVSALVGIAAAEGILHGTDDRLCTYYPSAWDCGATADPRSRITVGHVLDLTTALEWAEDWRGGVLTVNDTVVGAAVGMVDHTLQKRSIAEPGGAQRYSTGDPALLTGVLQGASKKTVEAYAREKLFGPLGITQLRWAADSAGRTQTFAGLSMTLRDFAKLGLLYANRGRWEGSQILPEPWVAGSVTPRDRCNDVYRKLFHINAPVRMGVAEPSCEKYPFCKRTAFANVPGDGFFAGGLRGQYIIAFPSADLVIARVATDDGGSEDWIGYARGLSERVLDAIVVP